MATSTSTSNTIDTINATQSLILIKNMFRLSISSVCYLRGIFPADCFSNRDYAGVIVHQLECAEKSDNGKLVIKNNDAFLLSQWLEKGVFDALEKSYLKSLTFAVYAKENYQSDGILLETYQFLVEYGDEKQIKLNGVTMNRENMKKQAVTFIRCLVEFTGTLDELPEDRYLTMKLAYYDEYTPTDYEPEFFTSTSPDILKFIAPPMKIKVGKLETPYHKILLKFAGLESLMTENLQEQLIHPATSHKQKHSNKTKSNNADGGQLEHEQSQGQSQEQGEEDRLNHDMSAMMAQNDDNDSNLQTPLIDVTLQKVKSYIVSEGYSGIKECASKLKLDMNHVKVAFDCLVKEGIIRPRGRGYKLENKAPEEEETVDSSSNRNYNSNHQQDKMEESEEETTQSIFTSTPPPVPPSINKKRHMETTSNVSDLEPTRLQFPNQIEPVQKEPLKNLNSIVTPIQKSRKGEEQEYFYLSQEGNPNSKIKCSIIRDPLHQTSK